MTPEQILRYLETHGIFWYGPEIWNNNTAASLINLELDGKIESVSKQLSDFMNSSYVYVLTGTKVSVKTDHYDSTLEIERKAVDKSQ
jgi:hypothetical protein